MFSIIHKIINRESGMLDRCTIMSMHTGVAHVFTIEIVDNNNETFFDVSHQIDHNDGTLPALVCRGEIAADQALSMASVLEDHDGHSQVQQWCYRALELLKDEKKS